jgi:hypothetical protein
MDILSHFRIQMLIKKGGILVKGHFLDQKNVFIKKETGKIFSL